MCCCPTWSRRPGDWSHIMTAHPAVQLLKAYAAAGGTVALDGENLVLDGDKASRSLAQELRQNADCIRTYLTPSVSEEEAQRVCGYLDKAEARVALVTENAAAVSAVAELISDVGASGVLGIDMETTPLDHLRGPIPIRINKDGTRSKLQSKTGTAGLALDPYQSRVRLIQAWAGGRHVYVFDLDHVDFNVLAPLWAQPMAIFNAVFEVKRLLAMGVKPSGRIFDVMTAIWLTDGQRPSLEKAAMIYFELDIPKALGASDWGCPDLTEEQIEYAALDAVLCVLLWQTQRDMFDEADEQVQGLCDEMVAAISRMELNGMPIDRAAHLKQVAGWEVDLVVARKLLHAASDQHDVTTRSGLRAHLLNVGVDIESWPTTKSGLLSTRNQLLQLNADLPAVSELLEVRRLEKLIQAFGQGLIDEINPITGRVHASFLPAGASTGRFSSRGPNLQQMPKNRLAGFRKIFRAPEGRLLMALDYSQIELRAAGEIISEWFGADSILRQGFAVGIDAHIATAMRMTGKQTPDEITDAERQAAKPCNFGLLYRMGERGFHLYLRAHAAAAGLPEVSYAEACARRTAFLEGYPDLAAWQGEYSYQSRKQGYTETIAGRRWRWCWDALHPNNLDPEEPFYLDKLEGFRGSYAVNHPIQGSSAEVMQIALVRLDRALRGHDIEMVATVHDEAVLIVPDNDAVVTTVARVAVAEMTAAFLEIFPEAPTIGLIDASAGPTWGDLQGVMV
jgi:DNA polymerase I